MILCYLRYVEGSKGVKVFDFWNSFWICLFPTDIHYFKQKKALFLKKGVKMVGNRQTREKKSTIWKRETFYLTHFFNLNSGQLEKKVWHFEDDTVSGGGESHL